MANRPHKPTADSRQQAEMMAGVGVPQSDIALLLGISEPTLRKHYADDLARGMAKANARVGQSLFQQAVGGNVAAAIFWTKSRMGWSEKTTLEVTGKDGGPLRVEAEQKAAEALTHIFGQIAAAKASLH